MAGVVAEASREAYQGLLADERFIPYFRAATPIDVIERLRIGSRPPSRGAATSVSALRAIPWVFAWSQSRCALTGWYGLGTGLEAAIASVGVERLREMVRGWRFFATLLSDAEMVLAKCDMGIARLYASLAGAGERPVHGTLIAEFERTRTLIGEVLEQARLLEHNPGLARTLSLRNPYVDPAPPHPGGLPGALARRRAQRPGPGARARRDGAGDRPGDAEHRLSECRRIGGDIRMWHDRAIHMATPRHPEGNHEQG